MTCPDCALLSINGIACHETGCPSSHLFSTRKCRECGQRFEPENNRQRECSHSCAMMFAGVYCTCAECGSDDDLSTAGRILR